MKIVSRSFLPLIVVMLLGGATPRPCDPAAAASTPALADADKMSASHAVKVKVLDVNGKPAAGVVVAAVGIERQAMVSLEQAAGAQGWHWTTDANGEFEHRFLNEWTHQANWRGPGFGTFYFVAPPTEGNAGAVSRPIVVPNEATGPETRPPSNEWGETLVLDDKPALIELRIQKGIVVEGRAVDPAGKPQAGVFVGINHNAHFKSHTGNGGEMFERGTVTASDGSFRFEQVYPAQLEVGRALYDHVAKPKSPAPFFWFRTRFSKTGDWIEDRMDIVKVENAEGVYIEMGGADRETFRFYGKVTDSNGAPVAGAKIEFAPYKHGPLSKTDWGDTHRQRETVTDTQGNYEILWETPWVNGISASKAGFQSAGTDAAGVDKFLKPDNYDFMLQ